MPEAIHRVTTASSIFASIIFGLALIYSMATLAGEAGLVVKHYHIHEQVLSSFSAQPYDNCETMRLIHAEEKVTADMGFNAFHEFAQWGRDYVAEEPLCHK